MNDELNQKREEGGGKVDNPARVRRSKDQMGWRLFGWLLDILVLVLLAALGFMGKQMFIMESRMATVVEHQANTVIMQTSLNKEMGTVVGEIQKLKEWKAETVAYRFTIQDGKDVWKEISIIREHLAAMPTDIPPEWFLEEFKVVREDVRRLKEEVVRLRIALGSKQN